MLDSTRVITPVKIWATQWLVQHLDHSRCLFVHVSNRLNSLYELYNAFMYMYSIFAALFYLIHKQTILKDNLRRLITVQVFCHLCFWLLAGEWRGSETSPDLLQLLLYSEQNYHIPKSTGKGAIHLHMICRVLSMYSLWT